MSPVAESGIPPSSTSGTASISFGQHAGTVDNTVTAIAAFENAVRGFIQKRLLELVGENWWATCVPEKRRTKAETRRDEENQIRWHTKRGDSLIEYTELEDLFAIIVTHQDKFAPIIPDPEWAKQILKTVERSRNIIMHSGYLEKEDIVRLGMALRDWLAQVGG